VTGVARKPILISSSSAFLSARMSFATNCTPLRERNSFSWSHAPHPGWLYTTTCLAMVSSVWGLRSWQRNFSPCPGGRSQQAGSGFRGVVHLLDPDHEMSNIESAKGGNVE
jgi:hypothetical protein